MNLVSVRLSKICPLLFCCSWIFFTHQHYTKKERKMKLYPFIMRLSELSLDSVVRNKTKTQLNNCSLSSKIRNHSLIKSMILSMITTFESIILLEWYYVRITCFTPMSHLNNFIFWFSCLFSTSKRVRKRLYKKKEILSMTLKLPCTVMNETKIIYNITWGRGLLKEAMVSFQWFP